MTSVTTNEPKAPKERTVTLDCVHSLEETRSIRSRGVNWEHVERMVPFVADLPPIDVVALTGAQYGILAGYHRWSAYKQAERKTVKVLVHDLPVEEWLRFGVHSNVAHGLPLTLVERKAAAQRMLDDGDRRSDRAIATDCGLDHKTIGKLRQASLEAGATGDLPQLRVGRDGKGRRVADTREAIRLLRDEPLLTDEEIAERTGVSVRKVVDFRAMSSVKLRSLETFKRLEGMSLEDRMSLDDDDDVEDEETVAALRRATAIREGLQRVGEIVDEDEGGQAEPVSQVPEVGWVSMCVKDLEWAAHHLTEAVRCGAFDGVAVYRVKTAHREFVSVFEPWKVN